MKIGNLNIQENKSLQNLHTFGIDVKTNFFIALNNIDRIEDFVNNLSEIPKPIYFLGGGSNSLFSGNFQGTVVHIFNKGITLIEENEEDVFLAVQAGESWRDFVDFCVENEYYGIENLTAIPGQVGTAPIQNIGAYGIEAKDCISEVYYIHLSDGESYILNNEECNFGYRDSIFKHELKGDFIITEVIFKLSKIKKNNLEYGAIQQELKRQSINDPTISQISNTIRAIRESKLPDPELIGNGGSFFKNPVIDQEQFTELRTRFPDIVSYENEDGRIKIAAGWMIDKLGWKGKEHFGAAVHSKQALVLINKNNASGKEVWELAQMIQKDIQTQFGILLEPEISFIQ